ncbi:MAG: hypothetical protein NC131_11535 [Roseburia sp.]|nr:hypothetical protein [Roseburia sp.]
MDVNMIIQLVNGVGFPIAACVALFWNSIQERKYNTEQRELDRKQHEDETEKVRTAVENNTVVITKLLERMENK